MPFGKVENVAIIGAGPGGIAVAIQLKRFGIPFLLLEKNQVGGLLKNANLVENYPGFPNGVSGLKLVSYFEKHLEKNKIRLCSEEVKKLAFKSNLFLIQTKKRMFSSRIVVIASGTKPKEFKTIEIPQGVKDKILYEIYPILKVKRKKIIIVGAGDAAFDYALNLAKNNEIIILNKEERIKCLPLLWKRAKFSPRISYYKNSRISQISKSSNDRINVDYSGPKGISKILADYLIFAIGRQAQLDFLSKSLKENLRELENKGILYLVGDVKNDIFRQTGIAVGDGIMTAMKIHQKLKGMD